MKLSSIANILNAELLGSDVEVLGLTTDSNTVKKGDLYIARKGARLDGHDFIAEAKEKGAGAAMVERFIDVNIPQIKVFNSTQSLGKIARWKRENFNNPILAITGSCGKTTTKEILASILKNLGKVFVNIKSFNNAVGLPLTLWSLQVDDKYAVLELGANHPKEISSLVNLIKPIDVAVITNAEACHLEGFGSIFGVAKAKAEIFEGLSDSGFAILNRDNEYFDYWRKNIHKNCLSFGLNSKADVVAENLIFDPNGFASFDLVLPLERHKVDLPLTGTHNVLNALAAAAAASAVGVNGEIIKLGLENSKPVMMRQEIYVGYNGATIIDDTYNANPKAVAAALEVLARYSLTKVFVFGGMRELGSEASKWHYYVGKLAKDLKVSSLYVCGEFADKVAEGFGKNSYIFSNQDDLVAALKTILDDNKVVLVKGSRGAQMEKVVARLIKV